MLDQALTLRKVRRTKNIILAIIAVGMIVLILIMMSHKGVSSSPLFIPIPSIILIIIMGMMLMNFTSISFNGVEMATGDSPGQKFRSAQHGFKVGAWTGVLCLILVILFVFTIPWVESELSTYRNETLGEGTIKEHEWYMVDPFDLTHAEGLSLEVVDGAPMEYIIRMRDEATGKFEDKETGKVTDGDPLEKDLSDWPKGDYMTVFWTEGEGGDDTSEYIYELSRSINPQLTLALTGLLGVIAVSSIIYAVIAYVLMKRFEVESVGGLATFSDDGY